jgi:hypothetical protein
MLSKHTGTTEDTRGCEFHYTCFANFEKVWGCEQKKVVKVIHERQYVCNEFPDVEAFTLKELKKKMGSL